MSYYINLQKAIDYIENNLKDDIVLDQICKESGYSIPHFYRVFNAIIGCSIMEYVRRRKLSNAMFDIVFSKRSITEIAFEYGFESHEAFTRSYPFCQVVSKVCPDARRDKSVTFEKRLEIRRELIYI